MTDQEDRELKIAQQLSKIIDNLNHHWHSIELLLRCVSQPLVIDDRGLAGTLGRLHEQVKVIVQSVADLDLSHTLGELKYIGKRLNRIETDIQEIKNQNEKGLKKNIHLEFTCDGYELVKKQTGYHIEDKENANIQAADAIQALLDTLEIKEAMVLIERFALHGGKKKTLDKVGEIIGVDRERVRQIEAKALRKCRDPKKRSLVEKIMHKALREAIGGD